MKIRRINLLVATELAIWGDQEVINHITNWDAFIIIVKKIVT